MTHEQVLKDMHPLKRLFWPILRSEYRKILPMILIYSLIVFNYSLLKTAKDALIVTAKNSGASTIPFIKVWAMMPLAILSTLIFTRLANKYSKEKVFNIMMVGFLSFFFVFAFFLYPNQEFFHPHKLADTLQSFLPKGFLGLIAVFRNWTFTLFYVMSELWGTMIMTVLFWGFANEVTSVKEAGRFYAILGLGANIATIFAGQAGIFLSGTFLYSFFNIQTDRWTFSLMLISSIIIAIGLVILFVYQKLHAFLKETTSLEENEKKEREEKPKMGIRENFSYLSKSKYLICIALIVVAFNISLTLIEVVWKDQVHELYPYAADYSTYMGNVMTYIGILSTFFSVFICGQSVRRFGWTATAYITPVILLISGVLFFLFYFGKSTHIVISFAAALGTSPLVIASFLGAFQNCFSRAAKFTFFDVTKEMAFIPLSRESKLKGKAAIDGVGSRLGKSGASVIHQALFLAFGTVATSAPYVGGVVILIFFGWILAVRSLGEQFNSAKSEASLQKSNML